MKNNRVLFATIVVLLWTVNALNLQPFEFELRSTVAISKHRVPLLRNLAGEPNSQVEIAGQTIGMRVISCDVFEPEKLVTSSRSELSDDADLQTVKIRVRYQKYADIEFIEKWLESKTRPSKLSDRCQVIKSKLRAAKWRLDSFEHTLQVVSEDRKRRVEQIAVQNQEKPRTIKLVGFQRTASATDPDQDVIDAVSSQIKNEQKVIDELSQEWNREVAISNGFLQFSGAPKWFPIAESVGWRRGLAFIALSGAVWGICRFLFPNVSRWIQDGIRLPSLLIHRARGSLSIPNLGHVKLFVPSEGAFDRFAPNVERESIESSHENRGSRSRRGNSRLSIGENWIRGIVASGFVVWGAVVAARLIFDPAWRSLFISAPLAALSNLISGVGL